jgi:hypothetical protein
MPATPPQYAAPAAQTPPPGYAPAPGAPAPYGQPPAPKKKNTGLIIGIVVGVLLLLTLCAGVGVYLGIPAIIAFQGAKGRSGGSVTQPTITSGQSDSAATEPGAPAAEPPATEPAPQSATLSEATAKQLVTDYLGYANLGDKAKAKALVTDKYLTNITSDYYDLAAKDLKVFEVVRVEQGDGGYVVFVKETWSSGVWTNWYLVVDKGGKLVIDNTGTE